MNEPKLSANMVKEEKMRINFRDFFIYEIKGSQSDPVRPGVCSSSSSYESNCCASIVAIAINFNFTAKDYLCLSKSVVNGWSDLTLD